MNFLDLALQIHVRANLLHLTMLWTRAAGFGSKWAYLQINVIFKMKEK